MNCIECKKCPVDERPRAYRDKRDGKLYTGTRDFCSDECEHSYCDEMDQKNGPSNFIREM